MRTPAPSDRPTLASSRRTNWKAFLLQEWGLLLLAAALAVIIWMITSQRVVKERPLSNVEVQLEVDEAIRDRVGAVLTGNIDGAVKLNFKLMCSEREQSEALEALDKDGRPLVIMRITQPPTGNIRSFDLDKDKYAWPFGDHHRILVPESIPTPAGRVFALAPATPRVAWPDQEVATLPKLSELDERNIKVDIRLSRDTVSMMAPRGSVNDPAYAILTPDPINLESIAGKLVADGDIPFDQEKAYDLTFETWRNPPGDNNFEAAWRRQIRLPAIKAFVTLTRTAEVSLQNRVFVELQQEYERDPDLQKIPGLNRGRQLLFTGKLRGPKSVLDALAKDPDAWGWGIKVTDKAALPDGTMNDGPSPWKEVSASFFWYTNKPEYRDRGVVFVPDRGQDVFDLRVRWNKRK